jgi:hypothetical protein
MYHRRRQGRFSADALDYSVQEHKEAVAMRRYAGGTGRAAQGTLNHRNLDIMNHADGITQESSLALAERDGLSSPPSSYLVS